MYILKCICPSVLLFYCSPCPAQKDFFPTKPSVFWIISARKILNAKLQSSQSLFLTTENAKDTKTFRLFCAFRVQEK